MEEEATRKFLNDLLLFKAIPREELEPLAKNVRVALCMYIRYVMRTLLRYELLNMYRSVDDDIAREFAMRLYQYLSDDSDIIERCLELGDNDQ